MRTHTRVCVCVCVYVYIYITSVREINEHIFVTEIPRQVTAVLHTRPGTLQRTRAGRHTVNGRAGGRNKWARSGPQWNLHARDSPEGKLFA